MAQIKFTCTTSDKLGSIPIDPGRITFVQDTRTLYLDTSGVRTPYTSIFTLSTEAQRRGLSNPFDGFYYVLESHTLYHFDNTDGWVQLTSDYEEQIEFDHLPGQGEVNKLYVDGITPYRWSDEDGYSPLVGRPVWRTLSE